MITPLRSSTFRLAGGGVMAFLGLAILLFVLPDASQRRGRSVKAAQDASRDLERKSAELKAYQAEADRIRADRRALDELLRNMPAESIGQLHWKLSQTLFELSQKHGVRLVSVKYGAPSREGAKGSLLESVDVEFTVTGLFKSLKTFMLALEGGKLPFAVVSAKLDESPEGAHLTVVLRAFRQAPGSALEPGEGA
ncbi:hypothetical protein [Mesoterricola silvestris]|uniref:Uncharacterized protein n=1 Tax=Mesoterricola silvestris TaxID=2927979 RepID=A0AA48GMK2_9BACT|nr:hypothetical protein [Mesoterricola silvestris]BDU72614.1 hypothetical protein METEAL_17880 [Mesoterricola silvestris]